MGKYITNKEIGQLLASEDEKTRQLGTTLQRAIGDKDTLDLNNNQFTIVQKYLNPTNTVDTTEVVTNQGLKEPVWAADAKARTFKQNDGDHSKLPQNWEATSAKYRFGSEPYFDSKGRAYLRSSDGKILYYPDKDAYAGVFYRYKGNKYYTKLYPSQDSDTISSDTVPLSATKPSTYALWKTNSDADEISTEVDNYTRLAKNPELHRVDRTDNSNWLQGLAGFTTGAVGLGGGTYLGGKVLYPIVRKLWNIGLENTPSMASYAIKNIGNKSIKTGILGGLAGLGNIAKAALTANPLSLTLSALMTPTEIGKGSDFKIRGKDGSIHDSRYEILTPEGNWVSKQSILSTPQSLYRDASKKEVQSYLDAFAKTKFSGNREKNYSYNEKKPIADPGYYIIGENGYLSYKTEEEANAALEKLKQDSRYDPVKTRLLRVNKQGGKMNYKNYFKEGGRFIRKNENPSEDALVTDDQRKAKEAREKAQQAVQNKFSGFFGPTTTTTGNTVGRKYTTSYENTGDVMNDILSRDANATNYYDISKWSDRNKLEAEYFRRTGKKLSNSIRRGLNYMGERSNEGEFGPANPESIHSVARFNKYRDRMGKFMNGLKYTDDSALVDSTVPKETEISTPASAVPTENQAVLKASDTPFTWEQIQRQKDAMDMLRSLYTGDNFENDAKSLYEAFQNNSSSGVPNVEGRGFNMNNEGKFTYTGTDGVFIYHPAENDNTAYWTDSNNNKLSLSNGNGSNSNYLIRNWKKNNTNASTAGSTAASFKQGGKMNKYQQGGAAPAQSGQDMEAQVTQLVQAAMSGDEQATQTINKIIEAAKAGDQQAMQIAQMIQAIAKQIQGAQAQAAKRGAKLNYLHSLVSGCPEGTEAKYFRKGGHICKACVEKTKKAQEDMELPIEKCGGKTKKKYFVGGSTELPMEKCGGKTIKKKCLDGAKVIEEKCGGKAKKKCLNGAEIVENKCGGKAKKKKCLDGAKVTENKCGGKTKKKCLNGGILTIEALQAAYKSLNA